MATLTVRAGDVRVPSEAREALDRGEPVKVVSRDRPSFVLISPYDYDLIGPLLEQHRRGYPIPIERLLTEEDYEVMAEDSEDDQLAVGILESWND